MREKSLFSVISLFGAIAAYKPGTSYGLFRNMLEVYLSTQFSPETTNKGLEIFEERISFYLAEFQKPGLNQKEFFQNELEAHCYILSKEYTLAQRQLILMYLLDFKPVMFFSDSGKHYEAEILGSIASKLEISSDDLKDCIAYVDDTYEGISNLNPLLVITDNQNFKITGVNVQYMPEVNGKLVFVRFPRLDTILFKISGESQFIIGGNQLLKRRTYILGKGDIIYINGVKSLSYNEILRYFVKSDKSVSLTLKVSGLEYRFPNGNYGINKVNFSVATGELLAIMGGSGSGKTTLMNLLIGLNKPYSGSVTLNGINVHSSSEKIKGYIGYVPQDDALYENLTAFQNLFFIARLSLTNLSRAEQVRKVSYILKELGLWDIRDLEVGSPLDKIISGGQRKRLNIALELVRDPGILFLDEPTSGLSSKDSALIINVLRQSANKGRLIIMNIHQPSSEIFKMFDKLLFIDQGGYPVYFGPSMHVVSYLKTRLRFVDAHQNECPHCGNLNPDDVFNLTQVEKVRILDESKSRRQITPKRWHKHFLIENSSVNEDVDELDHLDPSKIKIPGIYEQFRVYFSRNLLTKLKDYQYLLLSLLLTPILSVVLSLFTRHINPSVGHYQYYENDNMPAFIFMSVIVALFVGVMGGATEIIKDRASLKRESFLNLSYSSYFFSKLIFLSILSGIQMASFLIICKAILKLPNISGLFFITLWLTAINANAMGLLLSSFFKTIASVYVAIPFLLIPQILFSGTVIDFNKINPTFASEKYVPGFANLMTSRWAYEAISVGLFIENSYSDKFYNYNKKVAEYSYYKSFMIPELEKDFFDYSYSSSFYLTPDSTNYKLIKNGISQLEPLAWKFPQNGDSINSGVFLNYINDVRSYFSNVQDSIQYAKDEEIKLMTDECYNELKKGTTNKKLEEVLTDERNTNKLITTKTNYIRRLFPIYFDAENPFGRSHFYAPTKKIGSKPVSTPTFNLIIIILFTCAISIAALVRPVKY